MALHRHDSRALSQQPFRLRKAFRRMLEIAEREDPFYTLLHQNAVFTGMKSELNWKAAPAFAMDFRAPNWSM